MHGSHMCLWTRQGVFYILIVYKVHWTKHDLLKQILLFFCHFVLAVLPNPHGDMFQLTRENTR